MNSMQKHKDGTLKDELPISVGAQYATTPKLVLKATAQYFS